MPMWTYTVKVRCNIMPELFEKDNTATINAVAEILSGFAQDCVEFFAKVIGYLKKFFANDAEYKFVK